MTEEQNALLVFAEELGEVAAELLKLQNQVSKAIRFGIDEQRDLPTSNRERIQAEWNDLLGAVQVLASRGIELKPDLHAITAKVAKVEKYTKYSRELGQISD
ncbi:hypothetical protein K5M76_09385 [Shewanella xiamenensis]|uniref:hypothetical protein n=1 Tax=Shewanella xiamenensis TaxID=332186 RepID=UPI00217EBBF6|nr:hypothetical protein [Shewanella xiamenensis]MCT8857579.1 hypothetical protein [Shewanella xiamenensis]UWG66403.1 hypothetical protein K5M76_09385 [Shewanella xiamenensis]